MRNIGYIRFSSWEEGAFSQLKNIELDRVFEEKINASTVKKPILEECLKSLKCGDTLHVESMDRLARNMLDLQNIVYSLMQRKVKIHFHMEKLIFSDTSSPLEKELFNHLNIFAFFEKSLIMDRQREGIMKAKVAGKPLGRKPKISDKKREKIKAELKAGAKHADLAKKYNLSLSSIYKI